MSDTQQLASWLCAARRDDVPGDVRHEARRALLDVLGCAIGGSGHQAVDIVMRTLRLFSGIPTADVLGRAERLDPLHAALVNGMSAHVHDFDDITPDNYVHPSAPLASALFAYASANRVSGDEFLHAFILGFEVESRIGSAVFPSHYEAGWHITSTAGVFGAAAAISKLIGLTSQQTVWALGVAATQASGLREMFGSMTKAFHPGRAAQNGYTAALLAREGFTAGERALEGPRGFGAVLATHYESSAITDGLNEEWALRRNTYKPFPCVHVSHPTIQAAIHLHDEFHPVPELIGDVHLRVAPSVLDLCGLREIEKGPQSKFCIAHCAAVGLVCGRAGLSEFTDAAVTDSAVARVRKRTVAYADQSLADNQAQIRVDMVDGRTLEWFLEDVAGTLRLPMTDRQVEQKFREQGTLVLSQEQVDHVFTACWQIDGLDDVGALVKLTVPVTESHAMSR